MATRIETEGRSLPRDDNRSQKEPVENLVEYLKHYAAENPGAAALWCFGLGFFVGWRLKPW